MAGRERIEHIIVLMMENRSFDHLIGFLDHPDPGYPSLDGVTCPTDPADPASQQVPPTPDAASVLGVDPSHSHESVNMQMFGVGAEGGAPPAPMNGFIKSYRLKIENRQPGAAAPPAPADIMKCFADQHIPVLAQLAKQFAVFTAWHASVPGETWPNRNYAHAATSDGEVNINKRWYSNKTIFELLGDAHQSWGIYHDGVPQVWAFWRLPLLHSGNFHGMGTLMDQIADDDLPRYAFIEPNHGLGAGVGNSQHPSDNTAQGTSFVGGERLIGSVYNQLVEHPDVFAKTLLLITYDEHGGFFDHESPKPVPAPDGKVAQGGFDFTASGVRVPAVAVSPLIPAARLETAFYDHAAIPKAVRTQFATGSHALTHRDDEAADFLDAIPWLAGPRASLEPVVLPTLPGGPEGLQGEAATGDAGATPGQAPPPATAAEPAPQELNELESSLAELAGAVKTALDRQAASQGLGDQADIGAAPGAQLGGGAATDTEPPFLPSVALKTAAETRTLAPGSAASGEIDDVLARF
jgi:phospholipase C